MSDKSRTHLLLQNLPKEVKAKFKAACAERGTSMKEAILQFMRKFAQK